MSSKKITRATFKSFLKKNRDNLFVRVNSDFDGMTDCVQPTDNPQWVKSIYDADCDDSYRLGHRGIWLVGSSRDRFTPIMDNARIIGFSVYNCCGSFDVLTSIK